MSASIILACLVSLGLGTLLGFFLTRAMHPGQQQRKELETQLEKVRDELKKYQQAVTTHFMDTSVRVNDLTESYRQLHEHLASGAVQLANPEISRRLIEAGYGKPSAPNTSDSDNMDAVAEAPEPPKDYAPTSGVLSEDYGLKEDKAASTPAEHAQTITTDFAAEEERDPSLQTG